MWTHVTKVTRVFRDKFPKDAQYDTVISVIRQEYNLNPDASHCLVDMQIELLIDKISRTTGSMLVPQGYT